MSSGLLASLPCGAPLCENLLCTFDHGGDEATHHEHGEGDEMRAGWRVGQVLTVVGEPLEARHPAEAAFDHPDSWLSQYTLRLVREFLENSWSP